MIKTIIVDESGEKKRLDMFIQESLPSYSRSAIKKLNEDGNILVNSKNVKAGYILKLGDKLEINIEPPKEISTKAENLDIDIIYEDEDLAVINKRQGMVVHPANGNYDGTLVNALLYHIKDLSGINGEIRPGIVHRLDKDTSGLLVIAKNDNAHKFLAKQLEDKTCQREYLAVVHGNIKVDGGHIETMIGRSPSDRKKMAVVSSGGRLAITNYEVLERFQKYTLVKFILKTGRTHQIRVHSKHIGHSVLGDKTYGGESKEFNLEGQLLHAYRLEFIHPRDNKKVSFECELPPYFQRVLDILRQKYGEKA